MALKAVVASLDEVEEKYRPLYVAAGDKFKLDAEGIEDTAGLKSALNAERTAREAHERELKKLKKEVEGLDPVKAREALTKVRELEEKALIAEGKLEEVVTSRTAAMAADHKAQVATFQTQLDTEKAAKTNLEQTLKKLTVEGSIRELAVKKGVKPNAVEDVVARMMVVGVGAERVRWDMRDGKAVALVGDTVKYGKDAQKPMSYEEGFELLAKEADHLFAPSAGGGANDNSGGGGGSQSHVISRADARDPLKYRAAQAAAVKAGAELTIEPLPVTA